MRIATRLCILLAVMLFFSEFLIYYVKISQVNPIIVHNIKIFFIIYVFKIVQMATANAECRWIGGPFHDPGRHTYVGSISRALGRQDVARMADASSVPNDDDSSSTGSGLYFGWD